MGDTAVFHIYDLIGGKNKPVLEPE
jgi:hypothetical protein